MHGFKLIMNVSSFNAWLNLHAAVSHNMQASKIGDDRYLMIIGSQCRGRVLNVMNSNDTQGCVIIISPEFSVIYIACLMVKRVKLP